MNRKNILDQISVMKKSPQYLSDEYKNWVGLFDFIDFLINCNDIDIPLFVSARGIFIYSVFIKKSLLKEKFKEDLMGWECQSDSWSYGHGYTSKGTPINISIYQPFDSDGSKLLRKAQPLIFLRSYDGKIDKKVYIEISQPFAHLHSLHFDETRNAYCRLNRKGDIDEIVIIDETQDVILTTIKKNVLDFHLFLSKSVLVRFFDVTRCSKTSLLFSGNRTEAKLNDDNNEIYARSGMVNDDNANTIASWLRGFQLVRNLEPRKNMLKVLTGKPIEPKKYEKFIAYDWKNGRTGQFSCDPNELANYFVKSEKPFGTSPAFFNPEVILKYKSDPEKYKLSQRSVTCRNSWHLKTYDINEEGQVHTYLIYLGHLPHSEQLHWKQYNEEPKGSISKRAYKTDFMGMFDMSYDPLSSLKKSLKKLEEKNSEVWSCPDENLFDQLNYAVSNNYKEWADEIHRLDKLVIEGFKHSYLKKLAKSLGCYNVQFRSIKLIEAILNEKQINFEEINNIINPLKEIHFLRTKFSGHVGGTEITKIRKEIISDYGNFNKHFKELLKKTDFSIKGILEIIESKHL